MAGGITDIGKYAAGTALDLNGGLGLGLASFGNPYLTGLSLLQGVGGLFGSKAESTSSAAYSGGSYQSDNNFDFSYSKPFFELDNPLHVAVAGGLIILAIYTYKKGFK